MKVIRAEDVPFENIKRAPEKADSNSAASWKGPAASPIISCSA